MNKAVCLGRVNPEANGHQLLYRLDPPYRYTKWNDEKRVATYIVASAVKNKWVHETYLFQCDPKGNVTNWAELPGSYRDGTDHAKAILGLGYTITGGK